MIRFAGPVAGLLALVGAAHAQQPIPRTPEGRPDFHGVWESRWLTPLERPGYASTATVSGPFAHAFAAKRRAGLQEGPGALHPDEDYDFSGLLPAAGGGFRTSLIVEPTDGRRPRTQTAKDLNAAFEKIGMSPNDPEDRSNDERCLSASGRAPLGITPGSMYRQIVQTSGHVVLYTEDQMSARVAGIDAAPRPAAMTSLAGDTVARWEGDTLVMVTTLMRPMQGPPGFPAFDQQRRVTERFTLTSPDAISYAYVLEDSALLTAPLHVQYVLTRTDHPMFESACHEGNYAMTNMLRGARIAEQRAARAKPRRH